MRVLLLNQTFHPDTVATAQYLTDLAQHLCAQGHEVRVVAGNSGYDDSSRRFPRREVWQGITIRRIPALKMGKSARWKRALEFGSFILSLMVTLPREPRPDLVIALTSPPLISAVGAAFAKLRNARFVFWVMDLNPDEAVAAGWLRPGSFAATVLDRVLRFSLRHSDVAIALDRFMAQRLVDKNINSTRIAIIPPWSFEGISFDEPGRAAFRAAHGVSNKFVVMYAGNHSPCNPLDSVTEAASALRNDSRIHFCFVGGGSEFRQVQALAAKQSNVTCLPYQPRAMLSSMLSAADMHVVTMGEPFVGMIHPCKIYNVLNVGGALLYVGPEHSHIVDLIKTMPAVQCFALRHGDVQGIVDAVQEAASNLPRLVRARAKSQSGPETVLPAIERAIARSHTSAESSEVLTPENP